MSARARRARDLEVDDEFADDGLLWKVTSTSDSRVEARASQSGATRVYYDPVTARKAGEFSWESRVMIFPQTAESKAALFAEVATIGSDDDERYIIGARIVEALRRAELIEIDGPGLAAHQIEAVLGIDEDEATKVCRLLVVEGYAIEYPTANGTPFWRFRDLLAEEQG